MKSLIFSTSAAAFTMLVAIPVPSLAQADVEKPSANRCEWRAQPQQGPRAPLRAQVCKSVDEQWTGIGGPDCDPHYTGKDGHWVWQVPRQYGPRGPVRAPVRVWLEAC